MNRVFNFICVCICAIGVLTAKASEPPKVVPNTMLDLQARIDVLASKIMLLQQAIDNSEASASQRQEFTRLLDSLQTRVLFLNDELNSNVAYVSDDVLASRSGPAYISVKESDPNQESLLSLSNSMSEESGLEISGFMDAVYETNSIPEHGNSAYLNQVEVDLAKDINERAAASLGLIYAEGFQIGVAQISYQIKQESESSDSPLRSWTAFAGQFDAPFGEDVANYPSNVRKTVSTPEIVSTTHECWNDVGIASNWSFKNAGLDVWAVRGFSLKSNADVEEPSDVLNVSGGTRLNLNVTESLRCGGSCALGWLTNGSPAMQMYGAHAVVTQGTWSFTAEGIVLQEDVAGVVLDHRGYYIQGLKELGQFFALSRVDYIEGSDFDSHNHLSIGGGAYLGNGLEFRSEYRADSESENNQGLVQIVATF